LGHFGVERNAQPIRWWKRGATTAEAFKLLLVHQCLFREQLGDWLFPSSRAHVVGQRLNEVVHALRQTLEPGLERVACSTYIISEGPFLRLRLRDTDWVDFRAFEEILRIAADASDPLPLLKRASTLYRGDLFAEDSIISYHSFREHLRDRWKHAMRRLADEQEKRDQVGDAILTLKRLIAAEPTFEPAVRQLMRLYQRIGSVGEAIRAYRHLKRALHDDIGAPPSRETRVLYDSIVREAAIEP
jgi:DNA-binding SARP family transcriptional activator